MASAQDSGDARFAIDQFGRWIANADTKASLLAAALLIMVGALGEQGRAVVHRLPPVSVADWGSLLALAVATGTAVASIGFLVRTVTPRIQRTDRFSRYSFDSVADAQLQDLVQADTEADREHGWLTASVLASIARRKFRNLQRAFAWSALSALAFLVLAAVNLGR